MSIAVQKKIDQSYTEAEPIWGDVAFMIGGEPADEGPKDPEEVGLCKQRCCLNSLNDMLIRTASLHRTICEDNAG